MIDTVNDAAYNPLFSESIESKFRRASGNYSREMMADSGTTYVNQPSWHFSSTFYADETVVGSNQRPEHPGLRLKHRSRSGERPQAISGDLRDDCMNLGRKAVESFQVAIDPKADLDTSEEYLSSTVSLLNSLWNYEHVRDQPFRDLLAAVEVSIRGRSREEFSANQLEVLLDAMAALPTWLLDKAVVDEKIDKIIDAGFDLLAPVKSEKHQKVRIILEFEDESP